MSITVMFLIGLKSQAMKNGDANMELIYGLSVSVSIKCYQVVW